MARTLKATKPLTILQVIRDLFPEFTTETWRPWCAVLAALFGLPAEAWMLPLFAEVTRRLDWPTKAARELWAIIHRRGGKSRMAGLLAVFLACFRTYRLAPGERGVVMLIAADRKQARVLKRYISALMESVPMLRSLITSENAEGISLSNGIDIEIHTASFRSVRGYTVVAAICDEIAFWPSDDGSANPDTEILAALRPAMATTGGLLICISSPYARKGELWNAYAKHFGKDSDVLVVQGGAPVFNPLIPQELIAHAYEQDEARARAEFGAQFRTDVERYVSREAVEGCTAWGTTDLPPVRITTYHGFTDPSGGSADSFTMAVAHRLPDNTVVLDCVREVRPPFSPEAVVAQFATVFKSYGLHTIAGDRYAGEWPREAFARHGLTYRTSEKTRSDIYQSLLPLLTSGRVRLLDHPRLRSQLLNLERHTSRAGRDVIDHAPGGGHDDVANAAAGALTLAAGVGAGGRVREVPLGIG